MFKSFVVEIEILSTLTGAFFIRVEILEKKKLLIYKPYNEWYYCEQAVVIKFQGFSTTKSGPKKT